MRIRAVVLAVIFGCLVAMILDGLAHRRSERMYHDHCDRLMKRR